MRTLLHLAENSGATAHEREAAYRRARALLKELGAYIAIPEAALDAIETEVRKAIAA